MNGTAQDTGITRKAPYLFVRSFLTA